VGTGIANRSTEEHNGIRKERATNRLLFALSQHPEGMTTQELAKFSQQSYCTTCSLLCDSGYTQKGNAGPEACSTNMPAALCGPKKYIPGSAGDEDLKEQIKAGSRG